MVRSHMNATLKLLLENKIIEREREAAKAFKVLNTGHASNEQTLP